MRLLGLCVTHPHIRKDTKRPTNPKLPSTCWTSLARKNIIKQMFILTAAGIFNWLTYRLSSNPPNPPTSKSPQQQSIRNKWTTDTNSRSFYFFSGPQEQAMSSLSSTEGGGLSVVSGMGESPILTVGQGKWKLSLYAQCQKIYLKNSDYLGKPHI